MPATHLREGPRRGAMGVSSPDCSNECESGLGTRLISSPDFKPERTWRTCNRTDMMEVKIAPGHTVGEFGSSDDPSGTDSAEKPGWLSYYPQLKPLLIPNVRPTGKELGRWAWGPVEELEIGGFTCAGKRFVGAALARACVLASELHHPNIVQFLGVCTLPDSQLPVAVTEVLWKSLRDFFNPQKLHLPQFPGQFPYHMRLYILADIAKGLLYLHTRNPPIIHRYINPVTIMLSSNMVAKITSFRHATKLDQAQSHYELEALDYVGWRWSYAPPEGGDNPETGLRKLRCVPNFDIYSYGAVALFVLTQDYFPWKMRTEVVWHQRHLDILQEQLGEQHPIVQLVTKCLSHDPALRPSADELIRQLELELKNQV